MTGEELTAADRELIERATETIRQQYKPGLGRTSRSVGAALRTASGNIYTGVSLTAATPRASVCAEPIAVGAAVTAGDLAFDTIVAVKYRPDSDPRETDSVGGGATGESGASANGEARTAHGREDADGSRGIGDTREAMVISACGVCRELIRDYDPTTKVVVAGADGPRKVPVTDLLPFLEWRAGGPP